jgi:heme/copper-type cytochrome/quinol oxidase subunit 2
MMQARWLVPWLLAWALIFVAVIARMLCVILARRHVHRYGARRPGEETTRAELVWTLVPLLVVVAIALLAVRVACAEVPNATCSATDGVTHAAPSTLQRRGLVADGLFLLRACA